MTREPGSRVGTLPGFATVEDEMADLEGGN